ncbi:MAG TPA: diguanylate cyclase [Solirubrobacteraceae bacterium]|nr:diguanylate cyclase [Solirubrobacteraceae bacterium]
MANVQSFPPASSPEEERADAPSGLPEHLLRPEDEVFDVEHDQHLGAERMEAELTLLLDRFPDAAVAAFMESGLFAEMPDSIKLKNHAVLGGRWAIGREGGEDREAVFSMWDRVRKQGAGRCLLHPVEYPAELVFYTLDMRERHGVIFGLFVPTGVISPTAPPPEVEAAPVPRFATVRKDEKSTIVAIDEAITQILGWSAEEIEGRRTLDFIHPEDHPLAIDNWMQMLALPGPGRRVRLRHRTKDGGWVWFELTNHNLLNDPEHSCVISEMVDISDEMATQEELRAREQLLDRLAKTVPVGLFQIDTDRQIVYVNERLREILGIESATTVDEQLATVVPSDRAALEQAFDSVLDDGLDTDTEVKLRLPPGDELHFCTISLRPLSHEDGTISGAIACVADVTDGARMREELKQRATFDELTGCYNRASILRALEANVGSGRRHADRAVMFLDLDNFKRVNDRYGHAAGDELLRTVAVRLRGALRDEDLVGRIGGDEFLVVCPDIGGPQPAMRLAERLAGALREGVAPASDSIGCQVSVGVVWSSGPEIDADTLVARADRAMYESKRERTGSPKLAKAHPRVQAPEARAPSLRSRDLPAD